VLSGTADTLESIECALGMLLADDQSSSVLRWERFSGHALRRAARDNPAMTRN
jgi:hypothetical protein